MGREMDVEVEAALNIRFIKGAMDNESFRQRCLVPLEFGVDPDDGYTQICVKGVPELPPYSTDIAAAFQVIEKMVALGYPFEIGDAKEGYYATYWNECDEPVYGPCLPECICKAALKALSAIERKDENGN